MIKGLHGLFYCAEADAVRAFMSEKLGFPSVDAGDGWLIFGMPKAEIGVHPSDKPSHEMSFWCDDVAATRAELEAKGVAFTTPITDQGFGLVTSFEMPGGLVVQLYEPRHAQP